MKKKLFIFFYIIISVIQYAEAQDIKYVRFILESLCASDFHGRGYVASGAAKAAKFIENEFENIGLKKFEKDYFQLFDVSVNTYPEQLDLFINGKNLIPGIDFQVAASSPDIHGTFKLFSLNKKILSNWKRLKNKLKKREVYFLIIDDEKLKTLDKVVSKTIRQQIKKLQFSNEIHLGGIALISNRKLTWHASQKQSLRPYVIIKKSAIDDGIKSLELNIDAKFYPKYSTQNVIGYIQGENDSILVISAHYDHLGRMGAKTYFPGANDNASGTALLLNLAKQYSNKKPKYTMVFMAFGAEELGLLGSSYFVKKPLFPLSKIKFMLNFDIVGTGDEGIQIVNGLVFKSQFQKLQSINANYNLLPQIKVRGESCNSDHCPFYLSRVPSFFIYTLGGIKAYHDIYDKADTLPLTAYENYFKLILLFIDTL